MHKVRRLGRVVEIVIRLVFGTAARLAQALSASAREPRGQHVVPGAAAPDRPASQRAEARKTYRFSKGWEVHEAVTYFTLYSYNFCWPVRTLRTRSPDGPWQKRTPAMAAGLTDHVWSLAEWLRFPAVKLE